MRAGRGQKQNQLVIINFINKQPIGLNVTLTKALEIAVQVNGKIKARLNVPADAEQDSVLALCHDNESVKTAIGTMNVIKEFYVKGKLVNIVVKP